MSEERPSSLPGPLPEPARIHSMDVLRGVALLGILVMNIQSFAMPGVAYTNPTAFGDLTGWNRVAWAATHLVIDQKMMTIFTMLFGAGLLVFASTKPDALVARRLHRRRMLWLMLFGILHAHLLWYGDILFAYAVVGLLVFRFRDRAPRALVWRGIALIAVSTAVFLLFGWSMRYWPPQAIQGFIANGWAPPPEVLEREIAAYQGSWLAQAPMRSANALSFETIFMLMFGVWRVSGVMLLGMACFKAGVLDASRPARQYLTIAAAGLSVGTAVTALGMWLNVRNGWSVTFSFGFGSQFNYWGSLASAIGWVGLVMFVVRRGALTALARRLASVGRMAFTNYIMQTLICTTIFYGHGFGLFATVDRVGQLAIVVAVWIVQLAISPWWLARYQFGPLEWLWRSLTYRARQPMVRKRPVAAV